MKLPFEDRMSGSEYTISNREIAVLESLDKRRQKISPLLGKVLFAHDTNGIAELQLNLLWTGQHELDNVLLDPNSILAANLVDNGRIIAENNVIGQLPIALHVVL